MVKRLLAYGALAIVISLVLWWRLGVGGVTLLGYLRILPGMTMEEVNDVLGESGTPPPWPNGYPVNVPNQGCAQEWCCYAGNVTVFYGTDGRVIDREWRSTVRENFKAW